VATRECILVEEGTSYEGSGKLVRCVNRNGDSDKSCCEIEALSKVTIDILILGKEPKEHAGRRLIYVMGTIL